MDAEKSILYTSEKAATGSSGDQPDLFLSNELLIEGTKGGLL